MKARSLHNVTNMHRTGSECDGARMAASPLRCKVYYNFRDSWY